MPQPFKGSFVTSAEALACRPSLAQHVGIIASLWGFVEFEMARLLAIMLHADSEVATAMYMVIKAEPARLAAMQSAAESCLTEDQLKRFMKLKDSIANTGRQRDTVVHAVWALSEDGNQKTIIWVDPRKHILAISAIITGAAKSSMGRETVVRRVQDHLDATREYEEQDFIDIQKRMKSLIGEITHFCLELSLQFEPRRDAPQTQR